MYDRQADREAEEEEEKEEEKQIDAVPVFTCSILTSASMIAAADDGCSRQLVEGKQRLRANREEEEEEEMVLT